MKPQCYVAHHLAHPSTDVLLRSPQDRVSTQVALCGKKPDTRTRRLGFPQPYRRQTRGMGTAPEPRDEHAGKALLWTEGQLGELAVISKCAQRS